MLFFFSSRGRHTRLRRDWSSDVCTSDLVMIAIALSCEPKVLIADEPTTALDVTIQAQILDLVKRLRQELGMAIIWVTHDLGVVASLADRVMVMYSGFIVERADVKQLYSNPKHPYTIALLQTLPELEGERAERLESIEGQPPDQLRAPTSCPFPPRCKIGRAPGRGRG